MPIDKVQTFSIVAGTMKCNAVCPDCVSKMTTNQKDYALFNFEDVEWDNFKIAADIAVSAGAKTVLITGKGEATLYPEQINDYLKFLAEDRYKGMPMKELQTNGLVFHNQNFQKEGWLQKWYDNNLRVMSLSLVDVDNQVNEGFYCRKGEKYPPLEKAAELLQDIGYTIRLSITMMKGKVDGPDDIERVIDYCKRYAIPQLSVRPVRKPAGETFCPKIAQFVEANQLYENPDDPEHDQVRIISDYVQKKGRLEQKLMHGAAVYTFKGQNLCLTDCLTHNPEEPGFRQLIFYSNGMLTPSWDADALRILDIGPKCRAYLKERKNDNKVQ
jgi:pyruvate-formate lyase-activating enzyme